MIQWYPGMIRLYPSHLGVTVVLIGASSASEYSRYMQSAISYLTSFVFSYFTEVTRRGRSRNGKRLRNVSGKLVQLVQDVFNQAIATIKWSFREVGLRLVRTNTSGTVVQSKSL